uniref:(northern house mosquito) hypothetical protein n=1 Tax=Culex pipiens TaxID=7175 RepID=A0A8D8BLL0_CULPI
MCGVQFGILPAGNLHPSSYEPGPRSALAGLPRTRLQRLRQNLNLQRHHRRNLRHERNAQPAVARLLLCKLPKPRVPQSQHVHPQHHPANPQSLELRGWHKPNDSPQYELHIERSHRSSRGNRQA